MPVVEHYEKQGKLGRISAVPPPQEVFRETEPAVLQACGP
jgi:adenylate kinase family enzyme